METAFLDSNRERAAAEEWSRTECFSCSNGFCFAGGLRAALWCYCLSDPAFTQNIQLHPRYSIVCVCPAADQSIIKVFYSDGGHCCTIVFGCDFLIRSHLLSFLWEGQGVGPVLDKRHGLYRSNISVPHVLYVRNLNSIQVQHLYMKLM